MGRLRKILMRKEGISEEDAESLIEEAREDLNNLLMENNFSEAWNVCETHFGLEPDYLEDLIC